MVCASGRAARDHHVLSRWRHFGASSPLRELRALRESRRCNITKAIYCTNSRLRLYMTERKWRKQLGVRPSTGDGYAGCDDEKLQMCRAGLCNFVEPLQLIRETRDAAAAAAAVDVYSGFSRCHCTIV